MKNIHDGWPLEGGSGVGVDCKEAEENILGGDGFVLYLDSSVAFVRTS